MSNSIVIENRELKPTGFLEIFAWSIVVIGAIGCLIMLVNAAPRTSDWGRTIPWNQGMIVDAILTFLKTFLWL